MNTSIQADRLEQRCVRVFLLVSLLMLVVLPFLVRVPPLLDYPNHLSRLWLIAGGVRLAPVSSMYQLNWSGASTNIGIDLLARAFGGVLGMGLLGPLLLGASLALPPLGAIALNRTAFGGPHWWQIGFALLAWGQTMLAGFLNFQIGLGLALLAASADARLVQRGPMMGFLVRAACAGVLLVFHPFASLFYGALIGGLVLGPRLKPLSTRPDLWSVARPLVLAGLGVAAPVVIFYALAPTTPGGHQGGLPTIEWGSFTPFGRIDVLTSGFRTYTILLDAPVLVALVWPVMVGVNQRRLRVHQGLLLTAAGLAFVALLMPQRLADTTWIDRRLPIMALLTFAAALRPEVVISRRNAVLAASALFALSALRTGCIAGIWIARQTDIRAVERVLLHVPPGAAVLPLEHSPSPRTISRAPLGRYFGSRRSYWHYPTLAIPWRRAFVPTLFTAAGKQPVRVRPPWDQIAVPEGPLASVHVLQATRFPDWLGYMRDWRERFDYILVVNADLPDADGPPPQLPEMELVDDQGFAQLFRVRRAGQNRGPQPVRAP